MKVSNSSMDHHGKQINQRYILWWNKDGDSTETTCCARCLCRTTPLENCSKRKPTKINRFTSGPSLSQKCDAGFPIRYRFNSKLFNVRRLQAKFKVQTDVLDKLIYADDMTKKAKKKKTQTKLQDNCDLTSSTKKTEVMYQLALGKPYSELTNTVNGQRLRVVGKFIYLGSILSSAVRIDDEVTARIAKAIVAFGRLRGNAWDRNGIRLDTKLKVYKSVVLPTLLYPCKTWT